MSLTNGTTTAIDKLFNPALTGIITPLLITNPYWQLVMYSAIGLYGVFLQYNQDKLNEIIIFIRDNPEVFTKEIVETEAFKDGFLIVFESYIKERNKEKREIIKEIFLGFIELSEEEKEKFELERLLDITNKIILEEVEILKEINISNGIGFKKSNESNSIKVNIGKTIDIEDFTSNIKLINDRTETGGNYFNIMFGLMSLGLVNQINTTVGGEVNNHGTIFKITELGKKFITYINKLTR